MPKAQVLRWFDLLALAFSGIALLLLLIGAFCWPGTGTSLMSAIRMALFLGLFASIASFRKPVLNGNTLVFLLFWFYLFLNALFFGDAQAMRRLVVLLVFVHVIAISLNDLLFFRRLISITAITATLCALFSVVYHVAFGELNINYRATPISGSGFGDFAEFYNPIDAGTHYVPSLVFSTWLALTSNRRIAAIGWTFCAVIIAVFLYFTYARTAWLAGMVSTSILLLFLARPHIKKALLWIAGIAALLVVIFGHEAIIYEFTERGLSSRDEIWASVISRLDGHWIFGYGAGSDLGSFSVENGAQILGHAHNLYLQVLYQFGLVGLILMVFTSIFCIVRLFRLRTNVLATLWLAILSGGLLSMLFAMNNFVGVPNRIWIYFWLPVAGCLALGSILADHEAQKEHPGEPALRQNLS
jgi:O-antigen ligase